PEDLTVVYGPPERHLLVLDFTWRQGILFIACAAIMAISMGTIGGIAGGLLGVAFPLGAAVSILMPLVRTTDGRTITIEQAEPVLRRRLLNRGKRFWRSRRPTIGHSSNATVEHYESPPHLRGVDILRASVDTG